MSPKPRKNKADGLPEYLEQRDNGSFRYWHRIKKRYIPFGRDRAAAIEAANLTNQALADPVAIAERAHTGRRIRIAKVIDQYREQRLPHRPLDTGTRKNIEYKLALYSREFGERWLSDTGRLWLSDWLELRCRRNDAFNKHRELLIDIWRFAASRAYIQTNEPEAILRRSLSKKLESNQKVRQRLEIDGFRAIRDAAPPWLQTAMDISLITLQARREVVHMQYADERDGWLYVIRDKTSGDSDMAFIRIEIGETLNQIIRESRLDSVASPFIVHRAPVRRRREYLDAKEHWTQIDEAYLTRQFKKIRDATGAWDHITGPERPTFHEIRSLGGRLYRQAGHSKEYVQQLMCHGDRKTTEIYLAGEQLSDDHFIKVKAELVI